MDEMFQKLQDEWLNQEGNKDSDFYKHMKNK